MKITLEKWKTEDGNAFFMASNNQKLYENMSDTFPRTPDECKRTVCSFSESTDTNEYIRAIKADSQIIGCIAAFFDNDMYQKNAEISYWLNADYRSKGIMSQVIKTFAHDLFSQFDLHRICARPFEHNKASRRALEKVGFICEGILKQSVFKNGEFMNSAMYALIKE